MKTIAQLLSGLHDVQLSGPADAVVRGICDDSRRVEPGALFAALAGGRSDGLTFVDAAIAQGAVAILGAGNRPVGLPEGIAFVSAAAPRRALAEICRSFHDAPDGAVRVVGVTGTNGKTTTTHVLGAALDAAGRPCAVGGTNGQRAGSFRAPSSLTTPEAPALWNFFARARTEGCAAAAIEVSSAALVADRTHAIDFAGAVLTGMGHDHFDTHGNYENYREAKALLFRALPPHAFAVLPADDAEYAFFREATRARVITFGENAGDWSISGFAAHARGARFRLTGPGFDREVASSRPGNWDARNLAAAVAAAVALGADAEQAVSGAAALASVDGRWEQVDAGQDFVALVDYAHTPEALERTLALLRSVTPGRVIVVFGCGGERDRQKRPAMGRIAGTYADVAIVTEDNPREEDPALIARDILDGMTGTNASVERVAGRAEAISRAVSLAGPGDAVLVTGKGHETYQDIGGARLTFDDRVELRRAIACARTA